MSGFLNGKTIKTSSIDVRDKLDLANYATDKSDGKSLVNVEALESGGTLSLQYNDEEKLASKASIAFNLLGAEKVDLSERFKKATRKLLIENLSLYIGGDKDSHVKYSILDGTKAVKSGTLKGGGLHTLVENLSLANMYKYKLHLENTSTKQVVVSSSLLYSLHR